MLLFCFWVEQMFSWSATILKALLIKILLCSFRTLSSGLNTVKVCSSTVFCTGGLGGEMFCAFLFCQLPNVCLFQVFYCLQNYGKNHF